MTKISITSFIGKDRYKNEWNKKYGYKDSGIKLYVKEVELTTVKKGN